MKRYTTISKSLKCISTPFLVLVLVPNPSGCIHNFVLVILVEQYYKFNNSLKVMFV